MPRVPQDTRGAETAIRFLPHPAEQRLSIVFDHEHSWVKPELVEPDDPVLQKISEQLLAHEQVHFLISCLMVRNANVFLTEQDNLLDIAHLINVEARRLNLQYDAATLHGLNREIQQLWEIEVMRRFKKSGRKWNDQRL